MATYRKRNGPFQSNSEKKNKDKVVLFAGADALLSLLLSLKKVVCALFRIKNIVKRM